MTVGVLLFGSLAEAAGGTRVTLELPRGSTVADLMARLGEARPALAGHLAAATVAVNQLYAGRDQVIEPTDELALIPPVSGG